MIRKYDSIRWGVNYLINEDSVVEVYVYVPMPAWRNHMETDTGTEYILEGWQYLMQRTYFRIRRRDLKIFFNFGWFWEWKRNIVIVHRGIT